ncbi:MAG: hypothetical protein ABII93_05365 [Chrysiogenia bacterium]
MQNEKAILKVQVEPIIVRSKIINWLFPKLRISTLLRKKVKFKITHKEGYFPKKYILKDIQVENAARNFETTFDREIEIETKKTNKIAISKDTLTMVFPLEGVYLIRVRVHVQYDGLIDISAYQKMLEGYEGQGWRKGDSRAFCYMPVVAINFQNVMLNLLTILLVILTILLLIKDLLIKV